MVKQRPLGAEGRLKLTIAQGGFSEGQRVTFTHGGKACVGELSRWLDKESKWEVASDDGNKVEMQAQDLLLEGCVAEVVVSEEIPESEYIIGGWRGRQAVFDPDIGDIVEVFWQGSWVDGAILELPTPVPGSCTDAGASGRSCSTSKTRSGSTSSTAAGKKRSGSSGAATAAAGAERPKQQVRVVLLDEILEVVLSMERLRRKENGHQHRRRLKACDIAQAKLDSKLDSGGVLTDDDILEVLREWSFSQNALRKNVIPEGKSWVFSDTLGLVRSRCNEIPMHSKLTSDYPVMFEFLSLWARQQSERMFGGVRFPFTSISLNFDYSAKLHRDSFNVGPSLLRSLGNFEGGELGYFPEDDKSIPLEDLPMDKMQTVNTKKSFRLIDGRRAHCVQAHTGERFSIVFFSTAAYAKAATATRRELVQWGVRWPCKKAVEEISRLGKLRPAQGYKRPAPAPKGSQSNKKAKVCPSAEAEEDVAAVSAAPAKDQPPPVQRYQLKEHPHLAMGLKMDGVYTAAMLVKKCKGDVKRIAALRRKLKNPKVFEPVPAE